MLVFSTQLCELWPLYVHCASCVPLHCLQRWRRGTISLSTFLKGFFECRNAVLSGIRSVRSGMGKNSDAGNRMLSYWTDAGIPMLAELASMPIHSYGLCSVMNIPTAPFKWEVQIRHNLYISLPSAWYSDGAFGARKEYSSSSVSQQQQRSQQQVASNSRYFSRSKNARESWQQKEQQPQKGR